MQAGKTLYVRLATNIGTYRGEMAAASSAVLSYGASVDASMARLGTWAKTNERELKSLGSTAGKFGLGAAVALGLSAKAAIDWQQAWTGVTKTVSGSDAQMSKLEDDLRSLTGELPSSHQEIAAVAQAAGQLGVKVDDIAAFTKTMINLGTSTNLSAEEAATSLARFNNIMGLSNSKVGLLGSSIVDLGNHFPTTEAEITEMSTRLAASGKIAGLSAADLFGYSTALTAVGVKAEAGGTAISKVFTTIHDATIDGGESLDQIAEVAGQSADEFKRAYEDDAAGAVNTFIQGLARMSDEGKSTSGVFKDLSLNDQRLKRAVLSLGQAGGLTEQALKRANKAIQNEGALAKEAGKFNETAASKLRRSWNNVKDDMIDFGETTLPVLTAFTDTVDALANGVGHVPGPIKSATVAGLALTAVLGGGVWAATKFMGAISQTRANIALLQAQAWKGTAALTQMNRAMMFRRAGKGIAAIAGLSLATSGLTDKFGLAHAASGALMGAMAGPWGAAIGGAAGLMWDLAGATSDTTEALEAAQKELDQANTFQGQIDALEKMREAADNYSSSILDMPEIDEVVNEAKVHQAERAVRDYQNSIVALQDAYRGTVTAQHEAFNPQQAQKFANQIGPVLDDVGLNLRDVLAEGPDGKHWDKARDAITKWKAETETAGGRAQALADSVGGLDSELESSADAADDFASSLDALFNPNMDYDEAVIRWHESLRALRKELGHGKQTLDLTTEAGARNVRAVQGSVTAYQKQLEAASKAGAGSEKLARMMQAGRAAIIAQGVAVGFDADQMSDLLNKYGLTPELVQTLVDQQGAEESKGDVDKLNTSLDSTARKHPTPKVQVENMQPTLSGLGNVYNRLGSINGYYASATVHVGGLTSAFHSLANLGAQIRNLPGVPQSDGGFYPGGIPAAADGLYTGSDAHISRAQSMRVIRYAEPETQGESFIPHAMSKRGKSTKILAKTAHEFGYNLSRRGVQDAGPKVVIVNNGPQAPMVGSLTLSANNRDQARSAMSTVDYELRRIRRGGRWADR